MMVVLSGSTWWWSECCQVESFRSILCYWRLRQETQTVGSAWRWAVHQHVYSITTVSFTVLLV